MKSNRFCGWITCFTSIEGAANTTEFTEFWGRFGAFDVFSGRRTLVTSGGVHELGVQNCARSEKKEERDILYCCTESKQALCIDY